MIRTCILACALAFSAPAFAAEQGAPAPDDTKVICKRVGNTGWRLQSGKVCKTAKAWAQRSREMQREKEEHGSYIGRYRCFQCG